MNVWAPVVFNSGDGTGGIVADLGTFTIVGGQFRPNLNDAGAAGHGTAADVWRDAYAETTVTAVNGTVRFGALFRVVDANNYYLTYGDNAGNINISKVVAGTPTSLAAALLTVGSLPGVFRAEIQGTTLRSFWRGQLLTSVVDSTYVLPGVASMYLRQNTGSTVDASRFEAGPLTASYTPSLEVQQAGPSTRARGLR